MLNKKWRQKDKATDVLSFPQQEEADLRRLAKFDSGPWEMGDIVISLERAKVQAREKKISFHQELEVLLVHGILHLLGYDHEKTEKEAQRMQRLERKLLKGD